MIIRLASIALLLSRKCSAFTLTSTGRVALVSPYHSRTSLSQSSEGTEPVLAASAEGEASNQLSPFEPGSHQELIYTLGVNLARQLGDVRPLVEDGQELASLAKGVLDVVVGRLDETQQAQLLIANKDKLNALLVERT